MNLNKELMSEVLDANKLIDNPSILEDNIHYIICDYILPYAQHISVYEAIHLIKKWADNKGYSIHSDYSGNAIVNINKYEYYCDIEFNKETEFEAVYNAGLWVFNKTKGEMR